MRDRHIILRQVGETLYGARWQAPLARDLGVTDRTIRNWAGDNGCPADVTTRLLPILRRRGDNVAHLILLIENSLDGNA